MADREQLYTALRNADAAGDTEAATKLAGYIQSLGPETAPAAPTTPAPEPRGILGDLGHQAGLFARAGVNGVMALPNMASDVVTGAVNDGLNLVTGSKEGFRFRRAGDVLNNLMDAAGVAKPENATERVVQDATSAVAGTGGMVKAGQVLAKNGGAISKVVGDLLSSGPGLQGASAATGGAASGITRENGGDAVDQFTASLLGSLAPSAVATGGSAALRGVLRGGEAGRLNAAQNLENFKAAGTTPTLGQVTGGRTAQAAESLLAKTPGGAGVIAKKAQEQSEEMAASVQNLADNLAPGANATSAGEAIERGIGAFKDGMKLVQQRLYNKLDQHIPEGTPIRAETTLAALEDLNADIAGAPALSKWFKNARIQGIEGGLKSDTGSIDAILSRPGMSERVALLRSQLTEEAENIATANNNIRVAGNRNFYPEITPTAIENHVNEFLTSQIDNTLPYESIKKLRTLVGRELADNSLVADVPRSKWSALYGALSEDLGVAAKNAGPKAEEAWNWANLYTKSQLERLEQLKGIVSKDTPEKIFSAATAGSSEGATTITRVISALPKESRREVAAAVLQRMGRATNSQQNALGDAFSAETFLTNLSKFSPDARKAIFGRTGVDDIEKNLDIFAKIAEARRQGSKVFANPSGTAHSGAQIGLVGGGLMSALTGQIVPALGAVAVPAAAYTAAKILTGPAARIAATKTPILAGTAASALGAATRAIDPRLIPMSQRVELRGMAQPEPSGIDAIGEATSVDEAIKAANATLRDQRLIPLSQR